MTNLQPQDFINKWNEKYIDIDNQYGYQCYDLWARWCLDVYGGWDIPFSVSPNGYVGNLWTNFDTQLSKHFTKIPVNQLQTGDWCVWIGGMTTTSHIAMFVKDNGNRTGQFFSQNPNPSRVITISYNGLQGGMRPKFITINKPEPPKPTPKIIKHIVKPGEYLSLIGRQYNVSWLDIAKVNNIQGPDYIIYPDQVLNIPSKEPIIEDFKVGDNVVFIGDWLIYTSSTTDYPVIAMYNGGTIVKIYPGTKNPYLLNNGRGFVRKEHIKKL